ncbi:MAG TPA: CHRD domain-containing protein [Gaiellaceae bacterium]|jgi:hypothetical protein|nr:CHRD domain-containing protein [Gaiellaceae bacterium]
MKRVVSVVIVLLALGVTALGLAASAGKSYKVSAKLTPGADVPKPVGASNAKGSFTGTYVENAKGAKLTWKLSYSGLTGAAGAAHIHMGKPGVSGPITVPLCGPCTSGMTGTAQITKTVIASLESGNAYVNVHTAKNPAGEIRGQVKVKG